MFSVGLKDWWRMGPPVVIPHIPPAGFYARHQFLETWARFLAFAVNYEHRQWWCSRPSTVPAEKVQDRPDCLIGKTYTLPYQFFNQVPITDTGTTGGPVGKDVPGGHNKFT